MLPAINVSETATRPIVTSYQYVGSSGWTYHSTSSLDWRRFVNRKPQTVDSVPHGARPMHSWYRSGAASFILDGVVIYRSTGGWVNWRNEGPVMSASSFNPFGFMNASDVWTSNECPEKNLDSRLIKGLLSQWTEAECQLAAAGHQMGETVKLFTELVNRCIGFKRECVRLVADGAVATAQTAWNAAKRRRGAGAVQTATRVTRRKKRRKPVKHDRGYSKKTLWYEIPDLYLQWLYGVRPVLEDLANATDQLEQTLADNPDRTVIFLRRSIEVISGLIERPADFSRYFYEVRQRDTAVLRFSIPGYILDSFGGGALAPFSTFWELTPFSFVLDWVLPVGESLSAIETAQIAPFFTSGCKSRKLSATVTDIKQRTPPGIEILQWETGKFSLKEEMFHRKVFLNYPYEEVFRIPDLRHQLGLDHLAQSLSLLVQVMKGSKPQNNGG